MNLKQTLSAVMVGAMVLTAAPSLSVLPQAAQSTAYAAKGGARMSIPKSAPAAPKAPAASTNNNASKSVSGNGSSYAPSKDAKSLNKEAPAANSKSNAAAGTNTQAQSSSRLGSIMRGIGIFAGGMLLGSLLSSLFGMGGGMFADILGLIMNGILLVMAIMVVRWLWNKFRGTKNNDRSHAAGNAYRQPLEMRPDKPEEAHGRTPVQDIKPPTAEMNGCDTKSMADRYRNR